MTDTVQLADYFGLDPMLVQPSTWSEMTTQELHTLRRKAADLNEELRQVASDLRYEREQRVRVVYCVDFEVIYSALNWFSYRSREAAWARTALDLDAAEILVLPGAMYELTKYLRQKEAEVSPSMKPLATAFQRAFEEFRDLDTLSDTYLSVNEAIERQSIDRVSLEVSGAKYLYTLVKERFGVVRNKAALLPDADLFHRAAYALAVGSRTVRVLNNRADALDFCITRNLNKSGMNVGLHHAILSAAPSFKRLSGIDGDDAEGVRIRTPKMAAMHQLLRRVGSQTEAEDLAWRCAARLSVYTSRLDAYLRSQDSPGRAKIESSTPEDTLIMLLLSITSVQAILRTADAKRERRIGSVMFPDDPESEDRIYEAIRALLNSILVQTAYSTVYDRYVQPPAVRLTWKRTSQGRLAGPKRYVIEADGEEAYQVYEYDHFYGVTCRSNATLDQFLSAFNHLRHLCMTIQTEGGWEDYKPKAAASTGIYLGSVNDSIDEDWPPDLGFPVTITDLARAFTISVDEIIFARLNTHWFDVSFEDGYCGLASHLPIYQEAAEFLTALVVKPMESSELSIILKDLLGRSREWRPNPIFGATR